MMVVGKWFGEARRCLSDSKISFGYLAIGHALVEVKESVSIDTIAHAQTIPASFTTLSHLALTPTVHIHRTVQVIDPALTESDSLHGR